MLSANRALVVICLSRADRGEGGGYARWRWWMRWEMKDEGGGG